MEGKKNEVTTKLIGIKTTLEEEKNRNKIGYLPKKKKKGIWRIYSRGMQLISLI